MPPVSALLPHPLLSLLLLLLWLLMNNSAAPGQLLLGALFGLLIPLFTRRFWPQRRRRPTRPGLVLRFVGRVLWDIVVANFAVARIVLGPRSALRPVFVHIPLDIEDEFATTVLLMVISLTPGTITADLDADRSHLLVHVLSEDNPDELVRQIKQRYESTIKEIFGC